MGKQSINWPDSNVQRLYRQSDKTHLDRCIWISPEATLGHDLAEAVDVRPLRDGRSDLEVTGLEDEPALADTLNGGRAVYLLNTAIRRVDLISDWSERARARIEDGSERRIRASRDVEAEG